MNSILNTVRINILCVNLFLGIFSNFSVIVVMISSSKLRNKVINIFIINQSSIDLVASTCIFFRQFFSQLTDVSDFGYMRSTWCKLWISNLVHTLLFGSSSYNLVALSFERHSAIVKPLSYDNVKVIYLYE